MFIKSHWNAWPCVNCSTFVEWGEGTSPRDGRLSLGWPGYIVTYHGVMSTTVGYDVSETKSWAVGEDRQRYNRLAGTLKKQWVHPREQGWGGVGQDSLLAVEQHTEIWDWEPVTSAQESTCLHCSKNHSSKTHLCIDSRGVGMLEVSQSCWDSRS